MKKEKKLLEVSSIKEKVKIFMDFFYSNEDKELRELYKDFISISLISPNEEMIEFQTNCFNNYYVWLELIIQEAINKDEIIPESKNMVKGIIAVSEGFFLASITTSTCDLEKELNLYIDTIFTLMEVKK
jgi:hypothetical protein